MSDAKPLTILRVLNEFRDWLQAEHKPLGGRVGDCPKCQKLDELDKLIEQTFAVSEKERIIVDRDMLAALRDYSQQDHDGVFCGVSRQALEQAIAILAQLPEAPK